MNTLPHLQITYFKDCHSKEVCTNYLYQMIGLENLS